MAVIEIDHVFEHAENAKMVNSKGKHPIGPFWHSKHIHTRDLNLSQTLWAILATSVYEFSCRAKTKVLKFPKETLKDTNSI